MRLSLLGGAGPLGRPSARTGLYPSSHGLQTYNDLLAPDAVSIAEVFRRAGYSTAGFLANPILVSGTGFGAGFFI